MQTRSLLSKEVLEGMECVPRPAPKQVLRKDRVKTPWDFFKSVFKDYKPDNAMVLNNCFEFDWGNSKLEKIIKNPEDMLNTKEFLRKNY